MIKMICLIHRRADLTPQQFYQRWRKEHGALVTSFKDVLRIQRYVQSHRVPNASMEAFGAGRGWPAVTYDGVTEIWWNSAEDLAAAFATPQGMAASKILQADEAEFCDMTRVSVFTTEEKPVIEWAQGKAPA
ncbi:MAG: EthD domain-containing protein [Pseudomonadota bacterium]